MPVSVSDQRGFLAGGDEIGVVPAIGESLVLYTVVRMRTRP